jgi:hypothetical protein
MASEIFAALIASIASDIRAWVFLVLRCGWTHDCVQILYAIGFVCAIGCKKIRPYSWIDEYMNISFPLNLRHPAPYAVQTGRATLSNSFASSMYYICMTSYDLHIPNSDTMPFLPTYWDLCRPFKQADTLGCPTKVESGNKALLLHAAALGQKNILSGSFC